MSVIANLLIKLGVDTADASRELTGFSGKAKKNLQRGFLPAVATLAAVGIAAKKAGTAASDLGESQNAVSVVFGDSAKVIDGFSKGAARTAGLSMNDANNAAARMGSVLTGAGISAKKAAGDTQVLITRSADLASVFNTEVPEATAAMGSALVGEFEPMKKFGVTLTANKVKAKAMALGLADGKGALDDHSKAVATQALILEATDKVAGDFINTSGEFANSQRVNAAEAENLKASYGKGLIPVMNFLSGTQSKLMVLMGKHQKVVTVLTAVVVAFAAAVVIANIAIKTKAASVVLWSAVTKAATAATKVWTAMQWLLNAALTANPIGIVIVAVAALTAAIILAYRNSETFRRIVNSAFNTARTAAQTAFNWIKNNWKLILGILTGPVGLAATFIVGRFGGVKGAISAAKGAVDTVASAVNALRNNGALRAIAGAFASGFGAARAVVDGVARAVGNVIGMVNAAIGSLNGLSSRLGSITSKASGVGRVVGGIGLGAIRGFAKGGVVNQATLAVVGEAGPEAIVPLNNPRRANSVMAEAGLVGAGGPSVNINTMVVQDATDIDRVASRIGRDLMLAGA